MSSKKISLDPILLDINKNFITVKGEEFKIYFDIFRQIFDILKCKMKNVDKYFERYASKEQYAGSNFDGLKVGKPNEFDMDIIIRLPVDYKINDGSGISLEAGKPGFQMMKITSAFDLLTLKPDWESHHKITNSWRDEKKYFLQNKFRSYIESLVDQAINTFDKTNDSAVVEVNNVKYLVAKKKSGPAMTLLIRNPAEPNFQLDVDLVPVIQFELPRWPIPNYRKSPSDSKKKCWYLVPKQIKCEKIEDSLKNRYWRLAFHEQENEIIKGHQNMKITIRMLKKLRDNLGLKNIASYYIKTLFLWEIETRNDIYWRNKVSDIFNDMCINLYKGIERKKIPYYWNDSNNLLESLGATHQEQYKVLLKPYLVALESKNVPKIIKGLLSHEEFKNYSQSDLYKDIIKSMTQNTILPTGQVSVVKNVDLKKIPVNNSSNGQQQQNNELISRIEKLEAIIASLTERVTILEQKNC